MLLSLVLTALAPAWHVHPAPLLRSSPLLRPAPSEARRHGVVRSVEGASVRVRLRRPLGIVFEEVVPGEAEGVVVADIVEGSNAWLDGRILVGDRLKQCSAVVMGGESALLTVGGGSQFTNWQRELIPCAKMDFDTIMNAIESNNGRLGYTDVVMVFERTENSVPRPQLPGDKRVRLDDNDTGEDWDWGGTSVGGVSTPIRPKPDKF